MSDRHADQRVLSREVTELMALALEEAINSLMLIPPKPVRQEMARRIVAAALRGERTLSGLKTAALGTDKSPRTPEGVLSPGAATLNTAIQPNKPRNRTFGLGEFRANSRAAFRSVVNMVRRPAELFNSAIQRCAYAFQMRSRRRSWYAGLVLSLVQKLRGAPFQKLWVTGADQVREPHR